MHFANSFRAIAVALLLCLVCAAALQAQDFQPPPGGKLDEKTSQLIHAKIAKLRGIVKALEKQGVGDPWLADVEIYLTAANRTAEHNEFHSPPFAEWTLEALDRGLLRARLVASGETPWYDARGFPVIRAYRSKIDGSLQPFAVTLPKDYGKDPKKKWRTDVVLHGRDTTLTEVKFLHQHNGEKADSPADFVRLDIFGRGNNAYRWAGETDVIEAINAFWTVESKIPNAGGKFSRGQMLDPARVVLRGFSMGGAGTWHLGLHMPDRWCVIGPGAGFTATHGYIKGLPASLPEYQEKCLRIYDAVDYSENAFNVPIVAYAGAEDDQLQAAKNIQVRLKGAPFADHMKLLIAPGLKHSFPPEWQKKAEEAYAPYVAKGRPEYPDKVRFVTHTVKYPACDWVEILGLERHYEKALVEAEVVEAGYNITTKNVQALHLTLSADMPQGMKVKIDGQSLEVRAWVSQNLVANLYLQKVKSAWKAVLPQKLLADRAHKPRKFAGVQGPIDDAFADSFLCVRGTAKAWHQASQDYADACLERFKKEWGKYWRGDLPVKDDTGISDHDIATKHLILFGDPASNSMIAHVLDGLPIAWDEKTLAFGGKSYKSAEHLPCLIYPCPLNPLRYVVLNSGHTFHEKDYLGTNALLYPRLGDYAILRLVAPKQDLVAADVVLAGLFDESWQIGTKTKGQ